MTPESSLPLRAIYRLRGDAQLGERATGYALLDCGHRIDRKDWPEIETNEEGWRAMRCRQCAQGGER